MTEVTDEILQEMVKVIVEAIDPERIILFGSRATERADADSDVDILIVDSEPFDEKRSRHSMLERLWRLLIGFPFPLDLLLFSRDEIKEWRGSRNHVIGRAMRQGKVLYERT